MTLKDNNSNHDPLDALVNWDRQRRDNESVAAWAFHAGDIVGLAKKRQRKRMVVACSALVALAGIASMAVINSSNGPGVIQPESVEVVQQQPIEQPSELKRPEDTQVVETSAQANPEHNLESFDQHLAIVDSSLSGFNQLKGSVERLNKIDRSSSVQQYQMHRNLAMLEVLKTALPNTN